MGKSTEKISFEKENYVEQKLEGFFEDCEFTECDFTDAQIENSGFTNCKFFHCNFSNAKLIKTSLTDCHFLHCKMMGISFDLCENFFYTLQVKDSTLDYASLYNLKLRLSKFTNCSFRESDLTRTDFTSAIFNHCDFTAAHFEQTNLEKADLHTSRNYLIDPEKNKIKKARFSMHQVLGLLYKYDIIIED